MGQPGNALLSRAGLVNFWRYNFIKSKYKSNTSNIYLFLTDIIINISYNFIHVYNNLNHHYRWLNSVLKLDILKFYRKKHINAGITGLKSFFLVKVRDKDKINSSIYVFKFQNWVIIYKLFFNNINSYADNNRSLLTSGLILNLNNNLFLNKLLFLKILSIYKNNKINKNYFF